MAWLVLIVSGMLEAVWATALAASHGFRDRVPTLVFGVSLALSMMGLAWAMRFLPTGTAYAVWVGIGASLTVVVAALTRRESPTLPRILMLVLLIASIVGMKVVS